MQIVLISSDNVEYSVNSDVMEISTFVKEMIDEDTEENIRVPLLNVNSVNLNKIIEFCKKYKDEPMTKIWKPLKSNKMNEIVSDWYSDFVDVEQSVLFELILAANYMDIKPLLDLTCAKVASTIKGKTPEEIRHTFGVDSEFTPEEEARIREENKWVEE